MYNDAVKKFYETFSRSMCNDFTDIHKQWKRIYRNSGSLTFLGTYTFFPTYPFYPVFNPVPCTLRTIHTPAYSIIRDESLEKNLVERRVSVFLRLLHIYDENRVSLESACRRSREVDRIETSWNGVERNGAIKNASRSEKDQTSRSRSPLVPPGRRYG